jgi:integrase
MSKSTRKGRSRKAAVRPKKPYPDFPLTPHASGAWQKKIRGKVHYFGRWAKRVNGKLVRVEGDGWEEALAEYKAVADDLHAGRTPRVKADGLTVADLCNRFLTAKLRKREAGELGLRMFAEYKEVTDLIVAAFGKTRLVDDLAADDFEALRATMAERWGPVRLGNTITRVKSVFKYGLDNHMIDKPVRFGGEFRKPDKAVLRRHRAKNGEKMLEADQLRAMVEGALVVGEDGPELVRPSAQLRAMILLGINSGFGNHDVASLPLSALDLGRGWTAFPRVKSGILRRCPLWPETVAALREALAERPAPKVEADAELVFLQPSGRRWVRTTEKSRTDNVSVHFCELTKKLGLHRDGIGFYTLRHVFRTVADATRDPVACDIIMGHTDPSMGGHYGERVEDARLRAVAEYVRAWLFGEAPDRGARGRPNNLGPESCGPSDPCDPSHENAGEAGGESGPENSRGSQAEVATPSRAAPESPTDPRAGSQRSQNRGPSFPADARPTLRLFVG